MEASSREQAKSELLTSKFAVLCVEFNEKERQKFSFFVLFFGIVFCRIFFCIFKIYYFAAFFVIVFCCIIVVVFFVVFLDALAYLAFKLSVRERLILFQIFSLYSLYSQLSQHI